MVSRRLVIVQIDVVFSGQQFVEVILVNYLKTEKAY
jgi:hypothetical protein